MWSNVKCGSGTQTVPGRNKIDRERARKFRAKRKNCFKKVNEKRNASKKELQKDEETIK